MPSPFPGMDPYLEGPGMWPDFHHSLMTYARDALQPLLRPKYRAQMGERLITDQPDRSIYPDISVVRDSAQTYAPPVQDVMAWDSELVSQSHYDAFHGKQMFVEIVQAGPDGEVISVVEVLSPSNKAPGLARWQYETKQKQVLSSDVNLVEIDLLLDGAHVLAVPPEDLKDIAEWDYLICISRRSDRDRFEVAPISLAQPLPRVAVPLGPHDRDVVLDLQAVFTQCYDNGAYAEALDYSAPLSALVSEEQSAWVESLLRQRGLRRQEA